MVFWGFIGVFLVFFLTWPVVPPRCDGKRELKKQKPINSALLDSSALPQYSSGLSLPAYLIPLS